MCKKMYYFTFWQVFFYGFFVFGADMAMIVLIITNYLPLWVTFLPATLLALATWHLFHTGFFSPIYLSETKIKIKGQEYFWDDIKIIAYPEGMKGGFCYQYVLYFGLQFFYSKETMKKKAICQVYLNEKNLDMILAHYNKEILVINSTDFVRSETIKAQKKNKNEN